MMEPQTAAIEVAHARLEMTMGIGFSMGLGILMGIGITL